MAKKGSGKTGAPATRTLEVLLQGHSHVSDLPIAVEIVKIPKAATHRLGNQSIESSRIASPPAPVWKGVMLLGRTENIPIAAPGRYSVQATLPDGRTRAKVGDLTEQGIARVEFDPGKNSPRETLAWAKISRPQLLKTSEEDASSLKSVWLQLWRDDGSGRWRVEPWHVQTATRLGGLAQYELHLRSRPGQYFVQLGGPDLPWRLVAVPADDVRIVLRGSWRSEIAEQPEGHALIDLVRPLGARQLERQVLVDVVTIEGTADVLLSYLASGQFDEARAVCKTLAERQLREKRNNPTAAAAAGYYLLTLRELNQVHQLWASNLANWMHWLPDGAVIDAWYLMRLPDPDFVKARHRLVEAVARGLPIYTRGLRILIDGLAAFEDDAKYRTPAVSAALKSIRRYGGAANWKAPTTTFIGRDPMTPGVTQLGRPSAPEHVIFVDPTDDDLQWKEAGTPQPALSQMPSLEATIETSETLRRLAKGEIEDVRPTSVAVPLVKPQPSAVDPKTIVRLNRLAKAQPAKPSISRAPVNPPERLIARMLRVANYQTEGEKASNRPAVPVKVGDSVPVQVHGAGIERIIGSSNLVSVAFLARGLAAARTVGCVTVLRDDGFPLLQATGVLASPSLLLTTAHVITSIQDARRARVEFDYQDGADGRLLSPTSIACDPSAFFFSDSESDTTVVALQDRDIGRRLGWTRLIEEEGKAIVGEKLSIIQHASGTPKQLALRAISLIDISEMFLHCTAGLDASSSGSPLFNDQWEIIGIHRAGIPSTNKQGKILTRTGRIWSPRNNASEIAFVAIEAVRVSRIVRAIKKVTLPSAAETLREELLYAKPPATEPAGAVGRPPETIVADPAASSASV
jgi:hypothetical protein